MSVHVGWFDTPEQAVPAFDPGLDVPCIVCSQPLAAPMKTISLLWVGGTRSLFFRVHKSCWEALSESERSLYEESVLNQREEADR